MIRSPEQRLRLLKECIEIDGSVLEGLRSYTGEKTNHMCRRLGLDPSLVRRCLSKRKGRKYNTTRRDLEVGLLLPAYCLDAILDGDGE